MYNVQCTLYCTTYRCWISHFGQEKATVTSYIWKWANTYTKHYWHTVLHHSRNTNKNNNLVCNAKLGTRQIVGSCNKQSTKNTYAKLPTVPTVKTYSIAVFFSYALVILLKCNEPVILLKCDALSFFSNAMHLSFFSNAMNLSFFSIAMHFSFF